MATVGKLQYTVIILTCITIIMQLWELLLQQDCPDSFKDTWHTVVHRIVEGRVNGLVSLWEEEMGVCEHAIT